MKPLLQKFFFLILFTVPESHCLSQDLSHLIPAAHYTLINTADDVLGLQEPVELLNAPFFDSEGIYSNGIYIGNHPSGSLMMTPFLDALYDSVFAIEMEFKFSDLDDSLRPVITCGFSYRWLGFLTWPDSTFFIMYNNGNYFQVPDLHAVEDVWYKVTLLHHTPSSLTEWYLDGTKVYEVNVPLDRNMEDGEISNTNFSNARTFKGYLRNLRVYGSEEITAIGDIASTTQGLKIYPNPTKGDVHVECADSQITDWSIADRTGSILKTGKITLGTNTLPAHDLIPGLYVIQFLDPHGKLAGSEKFVKGK